jgi:hypothetical protein
MAEASYAASLSPWLKRGTRSTLLEAHAEFVAIPWQRPMNLKMCEALLNPGAKRLEDQQCN